MWVCMHGCACSDVHVKARGQLYGLQSTLLPLLLWTKFKSIWISRQPPRPALSSASLEVVFPSLSVIVRSWPALLQSTLWFRFLKLTFWLANSCPSFWAFLGSRQQDLLEQCAWLLFPQQSRPWEGRKHRARKLGETKMRLSVAALNL